MVVFLLPGPIVLLEFVGGGVVVDVDGGGP